MDLVAEAEALGLRDNDEVGDSDEDGSNQGNKCDHGENENMAEEMQQATERSSPENGLRRSSRLAQWQRGITTLRPYN